MGYRFSEDKRIPLFKYEGYKAAYASLWHVAFLRDDDVFVFAMEDKKSIQMSLSFYEKIRLLPSYPVARDDESFENLDAKDKEVLRQVLGIPHAVFDTLNLNEDIFSQLHFEENLFPIKKAIYMELYEENSLKWYRDDFKLYCLENGVFFPYEETTPFFQEETPCFPVLLDENVFPSDLKEILDSFHYERMVIDFLYRDTTEELISYFKSQDSLSFQEKIDAFLYPDHALSEVEKKYRFCIKAVIVSLVNYLYDKYSLSVLHKLTSKMSYLSSSRVLETDEDVRVISSFNGEMYQIKDGEFFFRESNRNYLENLVYSICPDGVNKKVSLLHFYALLGLPYPGYVYLKKRKIYDLARLAQYLPFENELDEVPIEYYSCKRNGLFYSYLPGEKIHDIVIARRLLVSFDVFYDFDTPQSLLSNGKITFWLMPPFADHNPLREFFGKSPRKNLLEDVYLSYILDKGEDPYLNIKKWIIKVHEIGRGYEIPFFFSKFSGIGWKDGVDYFLAAYGLEKNQPEHLTDFLFYLTMYPLKVVTDFWYNLYLASIEADDLKDLLRPVDKNRTYEPCLPYPVVDYGRVYVAFSKDSHSDFYLCSCMKESIKNRIEYLNGVFERAIANTQDSLEKERFKKAYTSFLILFLGLPKSITKDIDVNKDLFPQLPFEDHICHLCNHVEPDYQSMYNNNTSIGSYRNYILSTASKYGMHSVFLVDVDSYDSLIRILTGLPFPMGLLSVDDRKIDPMLSRLLPHDKKDILSYLCCFTPFSMYYGGNSEPYRSLVSLPDDRIEEIFYGSENRDVVTYRGNKSIFSILFYLLHLEADYDIQMMKKDGLSLYGYNTTFFPDYNPKFPYPYICLGRVYNAYKPNRDKDEMYFCECDKESMLYFLPVILDWLMDMLVEKSLMTPIALGVLGFPLEAILKYKDFDFMLHSPEEFVNETLSFKPGICRRCRNLAHAAFDGIDKVFPFKDDRLAEYSFVNNALAHEHILLIADSIQRFRYDPSYVFEPRDIKIPLLFHHNAADVSYKALSFFQMGNEVLKDLLGDFEKTFRSPSEALALACSIILDDYYANPDIFVEFFFGVYSTELDCFQRTKKVFTQLSRVREELMDETVQKILLFVSYLFERFLDDMASSEGLIGR